MQSSHAARVGCSDWLGGVDAISPIPWLPLGMNDRHDLDLFSELPIDDTIRKPMENEAARAPLVAWPRVWMLGDLPYSSRDFKEEEVCSGTTSLSIPGQCRLDLSGRFLVKDDFRPGEVGAQA